MNLSLHGQQLHPILHISKWRSLPEKTGIHTVPQDLKNAPKSARLIYASPVSLSRSSSVSHRLVMLHYELVTSTKLAFLRLQNSKCKFFPMPSEFQFKESPLALGIPVQRTPLALGIPKIHASWCMDIFWNCPIEKLCVLE